MQVADVCWSEIDDCHGPASSVPNDYDDLLTGKPGRARGAMSELVTNLRHQGDMSDAAAALSLVVLDDLERGNVTDHPERLFELLVVIADTNDLPRSEGDLEAARRSFEARITTAGGPQEPDAVAALRARLATAASVVAPYLETADDDLLQAACHFVCLLGGQARALRPRLMARILAALDAQDDSPDERTIATLTAALVETYWEEGDAQLDATLRRLSTHDSTLVRAVALVGGIQYGKGWELNETHLEDLAKSLEDFEELEGFTVQSVEDVCELLEEFDLEDDFRELAADYQ